MSQNEQYDPKVLRKLQLAELEVFKDFIKIFDCTLNVDEKVYPNHKR